MLIDYVTVKDKSREWGISLRRVQIFCETNRIEGVIKFGKVWTIPKGAKRPIDKRYKKNKSIQEDND